jgi:hypothetical protein
MQVVIIVDRYQTLRSVSDNHVFVVCRDGRFYELVPEEVRKQGPWQGMHRDACRRQSIRHIGGEAAGEGKKPS